LADDDEAKWLTGERQSTSKGPQPREGGHGGERRLSAVPDGDDLLTLSDDERRAAGNGGRDDDELSDDLTAVVRAVRETPEQDDDRLPVPEADPVPEPVADLAPAQSIEEEQESSTDERVVTDDARGPADAPTEPTPERKRRTKRASVPSWDEIMFGKDDA
jgi:hypothetical protein